MVLCLKTRESRSLPGLSRISPHHKDKTLQRGGRHLSPPRCRLKPKSSQDKPHRKPRTTKAKKVDAGWSSPVARQAHNLKVVSSNLAPATNRNRKTPSHHETGFLRFYALTARSPAGRRGARRSTPPRGVTTMRSIIERMASIASSRSSGSSSKLSSSTIRGRYASARWIIRASEALRLLGVCARGFRRFVGSQRQHLRRLPSQRVGP